MTITNAVYTNPEETQISADFDGATLNIPADSGNRHYRMLQEEGIEPTPFEDTVSLDARKRGKKAEVDAYRDQQVAAGIQFDFGGGDIAPVDTRSAADFRNIQGLVTRASADPDITIRFRAGDDKVREISAAKMIELGNAVQDHVSYHYAQSWEVKNQVDAAQTKNELKVIEANW